MLPMTMDRGWSRETFAFALAIQNLALGIAQPVAGMLADRFGGAKVVAVGTLLYGLGLAVSRDVAASYGGSIGIGRSVLGGAAVTLRFGGSAGR